MKEELIKYVMKQANRYYCDDFPISNIGVWIRQFFDQYQFERLNPEDGKQDILSKLKDNNLIGCLNNSDVTSTNYKDKILETVCDSPTPVDK